MSSGTPLATDETSLTVAALVEQLVACEVFVIAMSSMYHPTEATAGSVPNWKRTFDGIPAYAERSAENGPDHAGSFPVNPADAGACCVFAQDVESEPKADGYPGDSGSFVQLVPPFVEISTIPPS